MTILLGGGILSGFTLFDEIDREELLSIPGDKSLMSLGVLELGYPGIFGVPGVFFLRVTSFFALGVTGKVVFGVPDWSVFTIFCHNLLRPKP